MEPSRYLACLDADVSRLKEVAARDLTARVPSCPDWDVAALVHHTGAVFLHKAESMRTNGEPDWPIPGIENKEPLALFEGAYADLLSEFAARDPADATGTWYTPQQDVAFWIRRMAQETVIHRIDAELALGEEFAAVPDDLALDGVDEVLVCFLSFAATDYPKMFPDLESFDGRRVRIAAGGREWFVKLDPTGISVSETGTADASVSGEPADMLRWLWRRADDDVVTADGDTSLIALLRTQLGIATQ